LLCLRDLVCLRRWALSNGHVGSSNSRLEVMVLCITMSGLKGVTVKSGGIVEQFGEVSIDPNKR